MSEVLVAFDPAVDAPAHHHPVYDYDSGPPVERGKFAIWLFLATEALFFGGLILSWIYSRHWNQIGFDVGARETELWIGTRGDPIAALARQVAMYLAHVQGGLTYTEIGKLFARDRTTVAHACCVIENRRDNAAFDRTIDLLECALHMQPHGQERSAQW